VCLASTGTSRVVGCIWPEDARCPTRVIDGRSTSAARQIAFSTSAPRDAMSVDGSTDPPSCTGRLKEMSGEGDMPVDSRISSIRFLVSSPSANADIGSFIAFDWTS